MRKAILLFFVAVLAAACEGPMGPPGRDGEPGLDGANTNWKIIDIDVLSRQWQVDIDANGNRFYFAQFNVPELTQFIYDNGTVLAYYELNGVQQPLPYTRHNGDNGYYWTRTIDFEFTTKSMTFYVTDSDFADDPPPTIYFRVVLLW